MVGGDQNLEDPVRKLPNNWEAIDAAMRQTSDSIPSEEAEACKDQVESEIVVRTLPEHQKDTAISDSTISTSSTPNISQSSDYGNVTASNQDQSLLSTSTVMDQQKNKQPQHRKCPCFLRSHRQEDKQIDHIQEDAWDEFNQWRK